MERKVLSLVPMVGIDGLQHVAARDHVDYGTFSEPEYGPMIEVQWQYKGSGPYKKLQVPEWRGSSLQEGCAEPTVVLSGGLKSIEH